VRATRRLTRSCSTAVLGALGVALLPACSTSSPDNGSDAGALDGGAGDDGGNDAGCVFCSFDAGDIDATLGRKVQVTLDSCNGIESGCHSSNAGGLSYPIGNEFVHLIDVKSTEDPAVFRVKPGDPSASYLYKKLVGDGGIDGGRMPLGGPYDPRVMAVFFQWIEAGAPNP
jgi:hypothetical protein